MTELFPYLCVDLFALAVAIVVAWRFLSFLHPLSIYLFFHVYAFSLRGWALFGGAIPLYGNSFQFLPVSADELIRAVVWADVGLAMFTAGALFAHRCRPPVKLDYPRPLRQEIVFWVSLSCTLVGLMLFLLHKTNPDSATGGMQYFKAIALWPVSALVALIYRFGFRWFLWLPLFIFMDLLVLGGYHRYIVVLTVIFLMGAWLIRHNRKWPTLPVAMALVLLAALFPTMKGLGPAIAAGDFAQGAQIVSHAYSKEGREQLQDEFLDQFAGALSLSDALGSRIYGRSYLAIVTLPVPRAMWPEKPRLGDHIYDIATPSRPYGKEGRIITYLGEAYMNFGSAGFLIVPMLLGFALTRFYIFAWRADPMTVRRFLYLTVYFASIQAFRDGLVSFVTFGFALNLPALFIMLFSLLPPMDRYGRPGPWTRRVAVSPTQRDDAPA